ncbi:acyl carrier protein [Blastopirellula marina]|uniref:Acyl carrier protein n=1 Tax=Blastopirellula marina TaxID=124 RepID=A0A2S8GK58_9BACT|nr:acyl carrier protein [Blastopirellula marina]PQO44827.1 acyl carrier protein [Blastopirellula marina]
MAPSDDEVFEKVREALVDALGVDEEEVVPEATMVGDLGAESIDFLDIVFRLEKAFGITIPRDELFPEDILTNAEYVQDGKLTADGLTELKKRMPYADLTKFEANPVVSDFGNLLTVNDMCNYVKSKLA